MQGAKGEDGAGEQHLHSGCGFRLYYVLYILTDMPGLTCEAFTVATHSIKRLVSELTALVHPPSETVNAVCVAQIVFGHPTGAKWQVVLH